MFQMIREDSWVVGPELGGGWAECNNNLDMITVAWTQTRRYPLITFTIQFDTNSLLWQSIARRVLNRSWSVRSFMMHDYGVEVTGRIDPDRLLRKLARAGLRGRICGPTFRPTVGDCAYRDFDRPYGSFRADCNLNRGYGRVLYGQPYWSGNFDGRDGRVTNECCDIPPGPFSKVAHEFLGHRHSTCSRPNYQYASSGGCLPWL